MDEGFEHRPDELANTLPKSQMHPIELVMYSKNQMTAAALLAGPFACAFLASENLQRLNRLDSSKKCIVIGLGITSFLVFLPGLIPGGVGLGLTFVSAMWTRSLTLQ